MRSMVEGGDRPFSWGAKRPRNERYAFRKSGDKQT